MAGEDDNYNAPLRRPADLVERLRHVEELVAQLPRMRDDLEVLPKLSAQLVDVQTKIRNLSTHDEDQAAQMKRLADSFQQTVDQMRDKFQQSLEQRDDKFQQALDRQRQEHRRALEEQESRWREAQEKTELRWQQAQQRTIQEAVNQFAVLMARSIGQRVGPWIWAIIVSAVSMVATYIWTKLTK